jgi:UDP-glucose 4-epimerase
MKLLVTGGAGYIGSVMTAQLIEGGHETTVLDNLVKGHRHAVSPQAHFVQCDLLDSARLKETLREGFDGVLHFAALSLVGESVGNPERYYRNNVVGTLNLLDAMREADIKRLVFSSTAAVYGAPEEIPILETALARPTNPYGGSKLAIDQMIGFEAAAHGLAAVSLRYFNVAGASGDLGEAHHPETHLIPLVLSAAVGRREAIDVYGTDYPTRDKTAIRDYIHVEDLARAHILALNAASQGQHQIYNLGNGRGFSVLEVIETARQVTGRAIKANKVGRRAGDPPVLVASSEKIQKELGWQPQKSELATMIEDTWNWLQAHPHGYAD